MKRIEVIDRWSLCLVSLIAWLWIYPHILVGLHWHDTSEFITAGRTLAVAHPPGHPLTLIGIHLSQLLPWFDAAERGHLASSFWGILGVGAMYLGLQYLLMSSISAKSQSHELITEYNQTQSFQDLLLIRLIAGLGALCSIGLPMVWLQVTRAEVYAPQWALTAVVWSALFYAQRFDDQRGYLMAAGALGLLSANHTLLTAALGLALIPRLLFLNLSLRAWVMSFTSYTIGVSLYFYIWARGTSGGLGGWGWIVDWKSFWETVSAKVWQTQVEQRVVEVDLIENIVRLTAFCMNQVGVVVSLILLIVLGLAVVDGVRTYGVNLQADEHHPRSDNVFRLWGPTLGLATLLIAMTKLTYPFSEGNPDFSGYLAAGVPSVIFTLALLGYTLGKRGLLFIFSLILLGTNVQRSVSRPPQSRGAEAWGRGMTEEVSYGGTLWTSFYASHFIGVGLQLTEGWRTDINLVFRGHRKLPWALARSQSHPRPVVLKEIHTEESLAKPDARFEIERALDSVPTLWPKLTWPGDSHHIFTIGLTSDSQRHAKSRVEFSAFLKAIDQLIMRHVQLGDARVEVQNEKRSHERLIIDEDTAYTWALHFEMIHRWLESQNKQNLNSYEINHLMKMSLALRDHWIKIIAEEKWDSVNFYLSDP